MELPPKILSAHSGEAMVVLDGEKLSRKFSILTRDALVEIGVLGSDEIVTIHPPISLIRGQIRIVIEEAFSGTGEEFETFLRKAHIAQHGQSSYHYHNYSKRRRKMDPEGRRADREVYYNQTPSLKGIEDKRGWTQWELALILSDDRPSDIELSKKLHRTLRAIHVKRSKFLAAKNPRQTIEVITLAEYMEAGQQTVDAQ